MSNEDPNDNAIRLRPHWAGRYVNGGFIVLWLCVWAIGEFLVAWLLAKGAAVLLTGMPPDPMHAPPELGPVLLVGLFMIVWLSRALANSYEQHCTGMGTFPPCTYTIKMHSYGTRNGDSYSSVTTISTTYSGPSDPCDLFPPDCTQFNSHGTRTGPADPVYCATPTLLSTWGALKSRYR